MAASRSIRRARYAALVAVATGSVVVGLAAPAADATSSTATSTTYAHVQRICSSPQPNHATCFALRLIRTDHPTAHSVPLVRPMTAASPSYGIGPAGGYTPNDLARAYGINPNAKTRHTVAIVDAFRDPNIRRDLNTFDRHYHYGIEKAHSLRVVNQRGGSPKSVPKDTIGWSIEQALDVEAVRGMCRNCKILLVEAHSDSDHDLAVAENYAARHADIVSNSFGEPETTPSIVRHQHAFNHPGVAILASTGDDGWYDWDYMNEGVRSSNMPNAPASLQSVIAVGGTTLDLNPNGSRADERVWNNNGSTDIDGFFPQGASGGGCSVRHAAPRWQHKVAGFGTLGCGDKRSTGDIAAVGDPITGYDIYSSYHFGPGAPTGWNTFGGTSLSSPLVAAMWALAGGPQGVRYPALTLYGHFKSARATHDVTIGGNGFCGGAAPLACRKHIGQNPNTFGAGLVDCAFHRHSARVLTKHFQCNARPGFDGPTGVGTPRGLGTFRPMAPHAVIGPRGTVLAGVRHAFHARPSSDPFPGGFITKYRWSWGDNSDRSPGVTAHHTYKHPGTYTIRLTVTDNYGLSDSMWRQVRVS